MDLKVYLGERRVIIDRALEAYFPAPEGPASSVIEAMRYSLFAGGKRLRPILCMAGAAAVGGEEMDVLPVAIALELIHTYSLIHDDLPALDNDDTRRGKPTNHKVFGEAIALLAGDGLLTESFALMTRQEVTERFAPDVMVRVIGIISRAAGYQGMVGGQVVDIESEGKRVALPVVEFIHTRKTGALIEASVTCGAMLGRGSDGDVEAASSYGKKIGLAFQIADDILDIEGESEKMGKAVGGDRKRGKVTYPAVLGMRRSKDIQAELVEEAIDSLRQLDHKADPLREIASYIINRKK